MVSNFNFFIIDYSSESTSSLTISNAVDCVNDKTSRIKHIYPSPNIVAPENSFTFPKESPRLYITSSCCPIILETINAKFLLPFLTIIANSSSSALVGIPITLDK